MTPLQSTRLQKPMVMQLLNLMLTTTLDQQPCCLAQLAHSVIQRHPALQMMPPHDHLHPCFRRDFPQTLLHYHCSPGQSPHLDLPWKTRQDASKAWTVLQACLHFRLIGLKTNFTLVELHHGFESAPVLGQGYRGLVWIPNSPQ